MSEKQSVWIVVVCLMHDDGEHCITTVSVLNVSRDAAIREVVEHYGRENCVCAYGLPADEYVEEAVRLRDAKPDPWNRISFN